MSEGGGGEGARFSSEGCLSSQAALSCLPNKPCQEAEPAHWPMSLVPPAQLLVGGFLIVRNLTWIVHMMATPRITPSKGHKPSLKTNKEHMQQFQTDRLESELRLDYTHANTDVLTTPQTLKRTPPVPPLTAQCTQAGGSKSSMCLIPCWVKALT